jgi:hypothetical protein
MKRALWTATAATVLMSGVIATPALADVDTLDPVTLTGDYTPQEICDEALKPNENSGFQTEPLNVSDTDWVDDGDPVRDQNVGDPVPTGTPTAGPITFNGTYYRNGNSPNVWGGGNATLHYPNSTQEYTTIQHQTRTVTVDCHVWKYVGANDTLVEPPGLQTTGNTATDERDIDGPNGFDTNAGPIDVLGETVVTLICISPNNSTKSKPGTWTAKHGFTGSCTNASTAAGGLPIPSGNAPTTDDGTTYFPH